MSHPRIGTDELTSGEGPGEGHVRPADERTARDPSIEVQRADEEVR